VASSTSAPTSATGTEGGTTPSTVDTASAECLAEIVELLPTSGDEQVPVDTPLTAAFSRRVGADDPWSISVEGVSGQAFLSGDGRSVSFQPDVALEYDHAYSLEVWVCDDAQSSEFRTLTPAVEPSGLVRKTYEIPWDEATFTQPPLTHVLLALLDADPAIYSILLQVEDSLDEQLLWMAGTNFVPGGAPDCATAVRSAPARFDRNPWFVAGPHEIIRVDYHGLFTVIIESLTFEGRFDEDGERLLDVSATGRIDTRGFADFSDGITCDVYATLSGAPGCVLCADGQPECLDTEFVIDAAEWAPTVDIVEACG
jgi:hypothetical protein